MKSSHPLFAALVVSALAACGGGGEADTTIPAAAPAPAPAASTAPKDVEIRFVAVSGTANTPVGCGSLLTGLGTTATAATITDLRVYLTDVKLVDASGAEVAVTLAGNPWQYVDGADSVVLIDLENGTGTCAAEGTLETNAVIRGTVPAGTYTGFRATVGVPRRLSHSDVMASAAPLDIMAMGWSWQTGRKFVKIEVNPAGGVTTSSTSGTSNVATYNLHLASTDCTGPNDGTAACAKRNLARIDLALDAATQQVAIDVAEVFRGVDLRTNRNDAVGCMSATSDLDCPDIFTKFGLDLATAGPTAAPQSVFRAIAR